MCVSTYPNHAYRLDVYICNYLYPFDTDSHNPCGLYSLRYCCMDLPSLDPLLISLVTYFCFYHARVYIKEAIRPINLVRRSINSAPFL